jgi:hypothetical protein
VANITGSTGGQVVRGLATGNRAVMAGITLAGTDGVVAERGRSPGAGAVAAVTTGGCWQVIGRFAG